MFILQSSMHFLDSLNKRMFGIYFYYCLDQGLRITEDEMNFLLFKGFSFCLDFSNKDNVSQMNLSDFNSNWQTKINNKTFLLFNGTSYNFNYFFSKTT